MIKVKKVCKKIQQLHLIQCAVNNSVIFYQGILFVIVIHLMKEVMRIYGHFDLISKDNQQGSLKKITFSSLDKYNKKSPYLQKVIPNLQKKQKQVNRLSITPHPSQLSTPTPELQRNRPNQHESIQQKRFQKANTLVLPKLVTAGKPKQSNTISFPIQETRITEKILTNNKKMRNFQKPSSGSYSATLQINPKHRQLQPIFLSNSVSFIIKTKAGTSGKQPKVNQDIGIAQVKLNWGLKLFSVCDGHGMNGHHVSAFIKMHLIRKENLKSSFKKESVKPSCQDMNAIVLQSMEKTNKDLLESHINTELSGSTVIVIVLYQNLIVSFNVGDSRAILAKKHKKQVPSDSLNPKPQQHKLLTNLFQANDPHSQWQCVPLSSDQKPDRPDQKERILAFGGRIFAQTNQKGQQLGPLRVWMKQISMPGLAMTRSFGDKAGIKAGTMGVPQVLQFERTTQDMFIVIASDGVWEYLQNEQVMRIVIPYFEKNDLQTAGERLIKIASDVWQKVSYSRDDITAVIVRLKGPME